MFPESDFAEFTLSQLADELSSYSPPAFAPLRCDRWLARSCLQKAIRRGQVEIAQRSLGALLQQDPRNVWRHLIIIALEDVGVVGMETVARVIFAGRNRTWRTNAGGEWRVGAFLVAEMANEPHCQAACDLLLHATNSPAYDEARAEALDADVADLADMLSASGSNLIAQGIAALAIGSGLHGGQRYREPATVFEVLGDQGHSPNIVSACFGAWRTTRNPMALLLPLVWQRWLNTPQADYHDDLLGPMKWVGTVPDYAIDQFTRVGGQVARAYVKADRQMAALFAKAGIESPQHHRALGDLLFLLEGSCLVRRGVWDVGDRIRLPHRLLPHIVRLGDGLESALERLDANRDVINDLRRRYHNT